jgi:hypothetical protein
VEGVLWGAIQIKDALLNGGNAVKDRGSKRSVVLNPLQKIIELIDLWQKILFGVCGP